MKTEDGEKRLSQTSKNRIKYPHTLHLPWSPGVSRDDKKVFDVDHFWGQEVVVTEKMDGENTTITREGTHARSLDSGSAPWRWPITNIHHRISGDVPSWMRICGENMYAKHSIYYDDLEDFFLVFNVWNDTTCLSWDETLWWVNHLKLKTVPVIYEGPFSLDTIAATFKNVPKKRESEGYVVRLREEFPLKRFSYSVNKYVREGHVQTDEFWTKNWKPNRLIYKDE